MRAIKLEKDILEKNELYQSIKQDFFDIGTTSQNNAYFTKYYNILIEYRIYYTYSHNQGVQIYSIKNRENLPKEEQDIFQKNDFTRENLQIIWNYMHPNIFKREHKEIYGVSLKLIPFLGAEVGVLELCQDLE